MEWATLPLKKYAEFTGRSRRREYWSFVALMIAVFAILYLVERLLGLRVYGQGPLTFLFQLAILLPTLAAGARRLHDTGRSGWWQLICYAPALLSMLLPFLGVANLSLLTIVLIVSVIGLIVLIVFLALDGTRGPNRYGPDPKGAGAGEPAGAE